MTDASDDTVRITRPDALDPSTGPRRAASDDLEHPDGYTADVTDDGSTVVARRESRRRQGRAAAASAPGRAAEPPPTGAAGDEIGDAPRVASVSAVRAPAQVIAPRATPQPRTPQAVVDTAAEEAARLRRSRRVALLVVVAASIAIVLAAAALIVLLAIG